MHRNQVVHGRTDQEVATKIKESIHNQVRNLYTTFQTDPNFILSRHHYLFTNRSLEQHLNLDIDSFTCWLRSVDDAQQVLLHHNTNLQLQSNRFFAPIYAIGRARHQTQSSSSDSTYSPSSHNSVTTTYDTASLETNQESWEETTLSTINTSHFSLDSYTSTSSFGTFLTTGSSDPPSIVSWSTSSEQDR